MNINRKICQIIINTIRPITINSTCMLYQDRYDNISYHYKDKNKVILK